MQWFANWCIPFGKVSTIVTVLLGYLFILFCTVAACLIIHGQSRVIRRWYSILFKCCSFFNFLSFIVYMSFCHGPEIRCWNNLNCIKLSINHRQQKLMKSGRARQTVNLVRQHHGPVTTLKARGRRSRAEQAKKIVHRCWRASHEYGPARQHRWKLKRRNGYVNCSNVIYYVYRGSKVGEQERLAAHRGEKVDGPRPTQPNSFRRLWYT